MSMNIRIAAYSNCDRAYVAWNMDRRIKDLRGFALYRRRDGGTERPVDTFVGFKDERAPAGTHKPSTEWPVQKFMWADFLVNLGDRVSYRVVPMTGSKGNLTKETGSASEWTPEIEITAGADPGFEVYFNRGIVASQWLSRRLDEAKKHTQLHRIINTPGDDTRNDLSEPLRSGLLGVLDDAYQRAYDLYAALFELTDPELVPALAAFGSRAHVILANGSVKKSGDDHNKEARATLKAAGVDLHDRMLKVGHLGHNKFVVLERGGEPRKVWTGSTNWSATGLCTQANNGMLIDSPSVASDFKRYWGDLRAAGSDFPPALTSDAHTRRVRGTRVTGRFTPVPELIDIAAATELIDAAKEGILFLMFNPGPVGTLFNAIIERSSISSPYYDPNLYIHGVMNQDPGTERNPIAPVVFMHRGRPEVAGFDVVLPGAVNEAFAYWSEEIKRLSGTFAMVHSKCVVLDPFGANPVVMTGSHNLGPKASGGNDDNLVVIEGAAGVAAAYAVTIMGIYNDYRWRFRLNQREARSPGSWHWGGLEDDDTWQDGYLKAEDKQRELRFWLGEQ
jgi:phosphatidylserine/phosphatidylglycerophosphate/cardiolipin synthase-like enzyme